MSNFNKLLNKVESEKEVSDLYIEKIKRNINCEKVTYIYNCDGYLEGTIKHDSSNHIIKLLMEFKKERNFLEKSDKCKVILQALYYIRDFMNKALNIPEVLLIGDKNTCFILSIKDISRYLDMDINWDVAASSSAIANKEIIKIMIDDDKINPFVFIIDEKFEFNDIILEIEKLAKGVNRFIDVAEENIVLAYDYFITTVIRDIKSFKPDEFVQIFISLLMDSQDNCKHRNNDNMLVMANGKRVPINGENFDSYFNHFKSRYKPSEVRKFTEISDRLVEDTVRRTKGEYYTPTTWVNVAHEKISEVFGQDWKAEHLVWDCAWGTGNLTRDYNFKNLYCSTIDSQDLKIGESYNNEAKAKFQYDFLDDDIYEVLGINVFNDKIKMPEALIKGFQGNKKVTIFMNPPFGAAGNGGAKGTSKKDISNSKIKKVMMNNKLGKSSNQLFVQFLYKIILLKQTYSLVDLNICFFSTPVFLTGESFREFRNVFLDIFRFKGGFIFKASNFASVKDNWGVSFSMWRSEISKKTDKFNFEVLDYVNGKVEKIGEKLIYNTDFSTSCSTWIREGLKNKETYDVPQFKNAINIKESGSGRLVKDSLGYCVNSANCVNENNTYVLITSSASCKGHGVSITKENFMKIVSNYAARKLISGKHSNWINIRDEYIKPDVTNSNYSEWNNDAVIYSIFSAGSQQSSLRSIEYKGNSYDIKNQFFFESRANMIQYAEDNFNNKAYADAYIGKDEAYAYNLLTNLNLSKEANDVLQYARLIIKETYKYREEFNKNEPKYQINNWDAGWYQIKALLNEYSKEMLDKFNSYFKILENKMRPKVYELGFLIKDKN